MADYIPKPEYEVIPGPKYETVPRVPFTFEDKVMGRSPTIQLRNLGDKIRYHTVGDRRFSDRE